MERVPYILVVGEKEQAEGAVSVRKRDEGELGSMSTEQFIGVLKEEGFRI